MSGMPVPVAVLRSAAIGGSARIGKPRAPAAAVTPQPDLATLLAQADSEGRARGREEGLAEGREEGRRSGVAAGIEEGVRKGRALGQASLDAAVQEATQALREREQHLQQLVAALESEARAHIRAAEDELVCLAFEVLARLLGTALCTPEAVGAMVRHLLLEGAGRELLAVHVHPDDAARLPATDPHTPWRPDPGVSPGGCIVRHAAGCVDARIDTILQEVRQTLLAARADGGGAP